MPRVTALEKGEQVFMPPGGETQARRFYGQILGMRETMKTPGEKGIWFTMGEGVLKITPQTPFEPSREQPVATMRVDHAEAMRSHIERGRLRVWDAPHEIGTRGFYASDPFGNRVELRERPGM